MKSWNTMARGLPCFCTLPGPNRRSSSSGRVGRVPGSTKCAGGQTWLAGPTLVLGSPCQDQNEEHLALRQASRSDAQLSIHSDSTWRTPTQANPQSGRFAGWFAKMGNFVTNLLLIQFFLCNSRFSFVRVILTRACNSKMLMSCVAWRNYATRKIIPEKY